MMVVRTLLVHLLALAVLAKSSASNTMSSAASFTVESREDVKMSTTVTFQDWLALHEKTYMSSEELELRQAIFQKNEIVVRRHNEAFDKVRPASRVIKLLVMAITLALIAFAGDFRCISRAGLPMP